MPFTKTILLAFFIGICSHTFGQKVNYLLPSDITHAQQAVMEPIQMFFDGLRQIDTVLVRNAFVDNPLIFSIYTDKQGREKRQKNDLDKYLVSLQNSNQPLDEPLWDISIHIDGNMAVLWAQYALYIRDSRSHCGVDTFTLQKIDGKWKIHFLAFTMRKDCQIPDAIKEGRN